MKMLIFVIVSVVLSGASALAEEPETIRLAESGFRLVREVRFQGRDLFDLAIEAGMYERKGREHLPGGEQGAVFAGGRTWHGSNGVGLVAYDPNRKRYAIYYFQDTAVPGQHLNIVYSDHDIIMFANSPHREIPDVKPSLEVYSVKHDRFARVEEISTQGARWGRSDMAALAARKPGLIGPSVWWDHTGYSEDKWISITEASLCRPERVTHHDDVITLEYHTGWGVDEFVTALQFRRSDLIKAIDKMAIEAPIP